MNRFSHLHISALLLLVALAATDAFAPGKQLRAEHVAAESSFAGGPITSTSARRRSPMPGATALHQSSNEEDASNAINVALITAAAATSDDMHDQLQTVLNEHPFCKMTGIQLSIADVPVEASKSSSSSSWNEEHVARLQRAEIACFGTVSAVKSYLRMLDDHRDVPADTSDEDRRKLPNRLDLVGDIVGESSGASALLMAACPNADTGRECLNSGRWTSNHIYYPKGTQGAVELKTEAISGQDDGGGEEAEEDDIEIDVEVWASSIAQAAGDVMERKSWGGGW